MSQDSLAPILLAAGEGKTLSLLGAIIVVKAGQEETGGRFSLIDYRAPAHWPGPPLHVHQRTDETFYVFEGTFRFQIGDSQSFDLEPGGFVFVPRNTPHKLSNPLDAPGRHLVLVTPGGFEGYFEEVAAWLEQDPTWPPQDREAFARLMLKYDTHPAT